MVREDGSQEILSQIDAQIALVDKMPETVAGKSTEKVRSSLDRFFRVLTDYLEQQNQGGECVIAAQGTVNVREAPNITSAIMAQLTSGETQAVDGWTTIEGNRWWRLASSGGWVHGGFVVTEGNCSGVPALTVIDGDYTALSGCLGNINADAVPRTLPGPFSQVFPPNRTRLNQGEPIVVTGKADNPVDWGDPGQWYQIVLLETGETVWVPSESAMLQNPDCLNELPNLNPFSVDYSAETYPDRFLALYPDCIGYTADASGVQVPFINVDCLLAKAEQERDAAAANSIMLWAEFGYFDELEGYPSAIDAAIAWINFFEHGNALNDTDGFEMMNMLIGYDLMARGTTINGMQVGSPLWVLDNPTQADFDQFAQNLQLFLTEPGFLEDALNNPNHPAHRDALWIQRWGSEWTVLLSNLRVDQAGLATNFRDPRFMEEQLFTPLGELGDSPERPSFTDYDFVEGINDPNITGFTGTLAAAEAPFNANAALRNYYFTADSSGWRDVKRNGNEHCGRVKLFNVRVAANADVASYALTYEQEDLLGLLAANGSSEAEFNNWLCANPQYLD